MIIQEVKVFRDSIHGYIKVPIDYVNYFIDTDIFQRLRGIEQTGMRILYPSARHDRFIHSLGTYHLGHKAYEGFRNNVYRRYHVENNNKNKNDHYQVYDNEDENEKFWTRCQILFEIACLLHDCGHAPFSHTMEFYYDHEPISGEITLKTKLKSYLGSNEFDEDFEGQGSPHERMSALLVCSEFSDKIDEILVKNGLNDVEDDDPTEFVTRMIIGCEYSFCNPKNQIKNCFIQLLNSSSIDVDSLDYIIRDAKLSGIDNMNIDVDRILGSLTLIEKTVLENASFNNFDLNTVIIKGMLKNSSVNSHKKSFSGKCRGELSLDGNCNGTVEGRVELNGIFKTEKEVSFVTEAEDSAKIFFNGAELEGKLIPSAKATSIQLDGIIVDKLQFNGHMMNFRNKTNGKFIVNADTIDFSSAFVDGSLNGKFDGEILGDYSDIRGSKLKCSLGFHKSSLSVIQNVIIARNYEYQWIYSHHKVVYYANYLLIDLLKNCVDYLLKKDKDSDIDKNAEDEISKMLSWKTMLNNNEDECQPYILDDQKYFRVNDADILYLYKKCQLEVDCNTKFGKQLKEYFERRYKKSLWKSYAEYHILFSEFTDTEKGKIFKFLQQNSDNKLGEQYGYLNDELDKKFQEFGLSNVVWVNGDSKMKSLNPDNTYILFKNNPMSFRAVSSANDIRSEKLNLFYIYYEPSSENIDVKGWLDYLKNEIKRIT